MVSLSAWCRMAERTPHRPRRRGAERQQQTKGTNGKPHPHNGLLLSHDLLLSLIIFLLLSLFLVVCYTEQMVRRREQSRADTRPPPDNHAPTDRMVCAPAHCRPDERMGQRRPAAPRRVGFWGFRFGVRCLSAAWHSAARNVAAQPTQSVKDFGLLAFGFWRVVCVACQPHGTAPQGTSRRNRLRCFCCCWLWLFGGCFWCSLPGSRMAQRRKERRGAQV